MIRLRKLIDERANLFDQEIARAKSKNVAGMLLREKKKFLCQNDLYYLCCLTKNEEIAKYPEYYKPFCEEVSLMTFNLVRLGVQKGNAYLLNPKDVADEEDYSIQRLYLCHRGFYKTTVISKVHSLQLLLNFPNIHILLAHNKQDNASDNLVSIKNYFLTTDIKVLYHDYIPKGKDWGNRQGFSIAKRSDWGRSEDNIEAAGAGAELTGRHYQVAKKNDLVTAESVTTEEQLRKTIDWDNLFNQGMFDNPQLPIQDYEGTKYHFSDLYAVKLNDPKIKLVEYPILKDKNAANLSQDNISNPKRFTIDGIRDMMKDMWFFNCQMLLKPDDPAKMVFKKEVIQYFTAIPKGNCYLLVDPASKRKKKSDWTVMLVVMLAWVNGKLCKFIVDGLRDKIDPKNRIDNALALARKWDIKGCGWEAIAFQETDCFYFEEARRKEKLFFTIEEIASHKIAKEDRIRSLIPEYIEHKWFWTPKGVLERVCFDGRKYDLTEQMEQEMLQFPLCEHDDILDTQTFINRIVTVAPKKEDSVQEVKEMTFGSYQKMREERLAKMRSDPWRELCGKR